MPVNRQLFDLEELDAAIERDEQSLEQKTAELGVRDVLDAAGVRLTEARRHLEELKRRHRDAETEVTDVLGKITAAEEQLYGGRITNPKELANLQHEVNNLKTQSDRLETETLGIIDLVEEAEGAATAAAAEYDRLDEAWQFRQKQLAAEIDQLKADLEDLRGRRGQQATQIEPDALALYDRVRQQKKPAVARVEQGICQVCRISLSASRLQRARGGQAVQCGTCGRILYIS